MRPRTPRETVLGSPHVQHNACWTVAERYSGERRKREKRDAYSAQGVFPGGNLVDAWCESVRLYLKLGGWREDKPITAKGLV